MFLILSCLFVVLIRVLAHYVVESYDGVKGQDPAFERDGCESEGYHGRGRGARAAVLGARPEGLASNVRSTQVLCPLPSLALEAIS